MLNSNEKLNNYFLNIGFVLLLVIFLVSLIGISRVVLSDNSNFQQHVISTSSLLQDIEEVEKNTKLLENQTQKLINRNLITYKLESNSFDITDFSFKKINENKSLLVIHTKEEIFQIDNFIGIKPNNLSNLQVNDVVIYFENQIGAIIEFKEEKVEIFNFEKEIIESIQKEEILGLILFENEKN